MKKTIFILLATLFFAFGCEQKQTSADIDPAKIYFFYSPACSHCHEAREYLDQHYASLPMENIDVSTEDGYELIFKCAEKFKLGNRIGTPLFCMGDNYIMGWSEDSAKQFESYVEPFLPKK